MPQKSAADIIADAKKAYTDAGGGKMSAAPAAAAAPAKPQTLAPPQPKKQATTTDELKERQANIDKVKASLPKLHTGGPVPADGAYQLKAGEHVLTAPEAARARKHALIHSGMRSLANPMQKSQPTAGQPKDVDAAHKAPAKKITKGVTVRPEKNQGKKISIKKK